MKTELMATIVGGMLKPDEVLEIPEQTRVKLTIETIGAESDAVAAWKRIQARLEKSPVHGGGKRFIRDELYERH